MPNIYRLSIDDRICHPSKSFFVLFFLLTFFGYFYAVPAGAQVNSGIHQSVLINDPDEKVSVIIHFHARADLSGADQLRGKSAKAQYVFDKLQETANSTQSRVLQILNLWNADFRSFYILNMVEARLTGSQIQQIAALNEVLAIIPNGIFKIEEPVKMDEPLSIIGNREDVTWGLEKINVPQVWNLGIKGSGVVVAGQDTGYEWEHPSLVQSYRGAQGSNPDHNYNWHDAIHELNPLNEGLANPCGLSVQAPCDDHNHGTHTMGTISGDFSPGAKFGMAPDATWIACRNMEQGWGTFATYMECFEFFLAPWNLNGENPDPSKAPHVIANSWACPGIEGCNESNWHLMNEAIANLKSSGVVVVVSAGNGGPGCGSVSNPAGMLESSFSVGATNINDTIAGFSSRGAVAADLSFRIKPDVTAPGVGVLSAIRNGSFAVYSGTSMAGPHVAGAVALIISANPALAGEVAAIEDILQQTAVYLHTDQVCNGITGAAIPNNTYGFGRIDVLAAVELAMDFTPAKTLLRSENFFLLPNPAGNNFRIAAADHISPDEVFDLKIYSVTGNLLKSSRYNIDEEIEISGLPAGAYFVHLLSTTSFQILPLIKHQ